MEAPLPDRMARQRCWSIRQLPGLTQAFIKQDRSRVSQVEAAYGRREDRNPDTVFFFGFQQLFGESQGFLAENYKISS